jgi:hypothetical protein
MKKDYSRNEIIRALRRFDEGSIGRVFDEISTEDLYKELDNCSTVFTADDLIQAVELGF